jgi:hypothetical protein
MKTNQQELNLKFDTMRGNKKSNKNWLESLNLIYQYLNENDITSLNTICPKLSVGTRIMTFLKLKNIVYKNEFGFYKWNDKIPVSIKIVDSYRKYQLKKNMLYRDRNPKVQIDLNKVIKVEPKLIREKHRNTNTQEIGLIRKFLKWIY